MHMKSHIQKSIIQLALLFLVTSCIVLTDNLSSENKEYLLDEFDSLTYIQNELDTFKVKVTTSFYDPYVSNGYIGIPQPNDGLGRSTFYFPDSIYKLTISIAGDNDGFNLFFNLLDRNSVYFYSSLCWHSFVIDKVDLNETVMIQKLEYHNCISYNATESADSNRIGIHSFIYNRDYGLLQLNIKNGEKYELIDAE